MRRMVRAAFREAVFTAKGFSNDMRQCRQLYQLNRHLPDDQLSDPRLLPDDTFARASPRSEGQGCPTAGEIGVPRLECSGNPFIKAHLTTLPFAATSVMAVLKC